MSANIIYSDSQMVVVTVESIPNSAPWLGQTTYLIDQMGRTTAILAQTDQPTGGVTLAPVPYTTLAQAPLPSKTASSLPSGWAYKGCYNDLFNAPVLSLKQPYNTNLTVQTCVWSCYQQGYSISGVEDRKQCFCGNAILKGTLADWDFDCNTTCSGNQNEICGGIRKMSVYSNRTLTTSQSLPAQSSELTNAAPTVASSPTAAISRTPIPAGTIAGAVIAAVTGITLAVALIFCIRRRINRDHVRRETRMQTSPCNTQAWQLADRASSWENFTKDGEANSHGLGLRSANFGSYHSLPELKERYEQSRRTQQPSSHVGFRSADTHLASTATYPRPQRAPSRTPLDPPTSILKNPSPTKPTKQARGALGGEDEQDTQAVPGTKNLGLAEKCVRFGRNQIREFGRSPFLGYGSNASET